MRLLDLFCGAGGAAMGYHRAGFAEDDAGFRYVFEVDVLAYDEATFCWYVPLSMLRCSTCGVLLDGVATDCGFCGEVIA